MLCLDNTYCQLGYSTHTNHINKICCGAFNSLALDREGICYKWQTMTCNVQSN